MVDIKKTLLLLGALLLSLTACSFDSSMDELIEDTKKPFSLSKSKEELYINEMKNYLILYHWKYDINTLLFSEKSFASDEKFKQICNATSVVDMDLTKYKGTMVIEAQMTLQHFNYETAGTVYFYFYKNKLIGCYYSAEYNSNTVFSLKDKNIFTQDITFSKYEDTEKLNNFDNPINIKSLKDGFSSISKDNNMVASIEDNKVVLYNYRNNNFYQNNVINFNYTSFIPTDVVLFKEDNKLNYAVLLCTLEEIREVEKHPVMNSKKIGLYRGNYLYDEIILDKDNYLSLSYYNNEFILFQDRNMEYYRKENDNWEKYSQISLEHEVQSFVASDIDGDGQDEYIMTDGKDLYMYHKQGKLLKNIWKTHIGIENNFQGNIFSADLNNDGVKEIYILDSTGTTIRYILDEKGLISQSDNIEYGEQIYPGDFNNNGKDDYIKIKLDANAQELYINKE